MANTGKASVPPLVLASPGRVWEEGMPELAFCLCSSTASTRPFSLHSTPDWHLHTHLLAEQKFLLAVMSEVFREMYLGTEIDNGAGYGGSCL